MGSDVTRCADRIRDVLSEDIVDSIGRETGFCKRMRKLTPVRAVWTFVVGLGSGTADTLSDFVRLFADLTGEQIQYKPFHDRLSNASFPRFLRTLCGEMMSELIGPTLSCRGGKLEQFDDIWIQDGSSFALNDRLAHHFPGRFKKGSPAAAEVHCTYSLLEGQAVRLSVAPDTHGERDFLPDPWEVEGKLLLMDRGYVSHSYFRELDSSGGSYICRAKDKHVNPLIVECLEGLSSARAPRGSKLKNITLPKRTVDLLIESKDGKERFEQRLVLFWVAKAKKHVILYTNLPAADFPASVVATAYRLRWQVELFFKECKSYTKLKKFQTADPHIAEGLIWGSMLAVLLRRHLAHSANEANGVRSAPFVTAAVSWMFFRDVGQSAVRSFRRFRKVIEDVLRMLRRVAARTNPKRRTPFDELGIGPIELCA
jgi:hypothetical protein